MVINVNNYAEVKTYMNSEIKTYMNSERGKRGIIFFNKFSKEVKVDTILEEMLRNKRDIIRICIDRH